jgi:hypothetical protein
MPRNPKSAVVAVRMAPSLREGLKQAADDEGCSLNAYIVQVLAAAAGHRARFRGSAETGPEPGEQRDELRELPRKNGGNPVDWTEYHRHIGARETFRDAATREHGLMITVRMMLFADFNCPWHYVQWKELGAELWPPGFEAPRSQAS